MKKRSGLSARNDLMRDTSIKLFEYCKKGYYLIK